MLNICIPVLNYDVNPLVNELHSQCTIADIEFRILIFEDGSDDIFVKTNSQICKLNNTQQLISKENTGRSAARNFLADKSEPGKIIFIDCDSAIPKKNYITDYLKFEDKPVVCGGTIYLEEQKQKSGSLRYKYGIKREMTSAEQRNKNSNAAFATNNFMISTEVFKVVRFREFLRGYGHEDSLFGFELMTNSFIIHHIDNPVIHVGIEDNTIFLKKTEQGLKNLILIEEDANINKDFNNDIRIIRSYLKLKKLGLLWVLRSIFKLSENIVAKHLLLSQNPCLYLFDLYKIGYYCKLKRQKND
jgi:glycosyltransferase involved in cell wall biosynthesis